VYIPGGSYSSLDRTETRYVCSYTHPNQIENEDPSTIGVGGGGYVGSPDDFGLVGGGGSPGAGQPIDIPVIVVGRPDPYAIPIPDIKAHMKCFDLSKKAKFTIHVDQPVAGSTQCSVLSDPDNVGHSFFTIEQGYNTRTVGFYPKNIATPFSKEDASQLYDNQNKPFDVSVTFEINPLELSYLLDYIENGTPSLYHLDNFNCTNWVVEACAKMGITLPQNKGSWFRGEGLCPGQFGEDVWNLTLNDRQVTKSSTGSAPPNSFDCD
jgi:hypothetical protein